MSSFKNQYKILLIEDSEFYVRLVKELLSFEKLPKIFGLDVQGSLAGAKQALSENAPERAYDAILLDLTLPDGTGLETFRRMKELAADIPIILFTQVNDDETAIQAMSGGAQDFLYKDEITASLLSRSLRYAIERKRCDKIISDQRQLLVHSAKLTSLGEMAGGIAHEINNPVATIFWKAGRLIEKIEKGEHDVAYLLDGIGKIRKTADRIAKVIRSLRMLSQDGARSEMQIVALSEVVQDALELCSARLESKDIRLEAPTIDPAWKVQCRPVAVVQVLLNLLNNAADAVEDSNERLICISACQDGGWTELVVSDSGPGISVSAQERLFQPLFTTKPVGKGIGLGLSLSRKFMEDQGGSLKYEPRDGRTAFVMRWPSERVILKVA